MDIKNHPPALRTGSVTYSITSPPLSPPPPPKVTITPKDVVINPQLLKVMLSSHTHIAMSDVSFNFDLEADKGGRCERSRLQPSPEPPCYGPRIRAYCVEPQLQLIWLGVFTIDCCHECSSLPLILLAWGIFFQLLCHNDQWPRSMLGDVSGHLYRLH